MLELLVVISIIGIIMAMLLPAIQQSREAARRLQCANNLKQQGLGIHGFHSSNSSFPMGVYARTRGASRAFGWATKILPHIGEGALYDSLTDSGQMIPGLNSNPWSDGQLFPKAQRAGVLVPGGDARISTFVCPSASIPSHVPTAPDGTPHSAGYAVASYKGSTGYCSQGVFLQEQNCRNFHHCVDQLPGTDITVTVRKPAHQRVRFADVTDGLSNTIAIGESAHVYDREYWPLWVGAPDSHAQTLFKTETPINCGLPPSSGIWSSHERMTCQEASISFGATGAAYSRHQGGAYFAFCDGSVRFLSEELDLLTFVRLGNRADGQPIDMIK